jgi:hypothetical protein
MTSTTWDRNGFEPEKPLNQWEKGLVFIVIGLIIVFIYKTCV